MRVYGRRPPKRSTPTWVAPNNRDGRYMERERARQHIAEDLTNDAVTECLDNRDGM